MAQHSIEVPEITKRFGAVSKGTPQLVNSSGTTTIYTPAVGNRIRLKWFGMASPDTNDGTVIATLALGANNIYIWPMGAPGAFMHSSVREGDYNETLTITLSGSQDVFLNMDIEEF